MAQRTNVVYVSDLSGTEIADNDAPTVHFSYDGTEYSIDLTSKEAEKFYKDMQPYLEAATKVTSKRNGTKRSTTKTGPNPADVRGWAKENGIDVPDRGRIPASVMDAYNSAN